MQRKCSPQQCQSKLESSRNRYWEQEVNVSSWLRSSQQKLCRENKSSLADSPSSTKTFVSCNSTCIPSRRRFHVCCFTRAREAPEDHHSVFPFQKHESLWVFWRNDAVSVNNHGGRGHDCIINIKTGTADSIKCIQKNCPNSRIRKKRHRTVSCGFPSLQCWWMTDSWSFGGVSLYSVFRLAGASGVVEAMMSIVEVLGVGQRSTWVLWPLKHSKKRFCGAVQSE